MAEVEKQASRLQELDALRGIAALAVVCFHFTMRCDEAYCRFLRIGATGVELFFIISGFVIFMTVQRSADGREFIASRFARLFPTYWACLTITFLVKVALTTLYFHKAVTGAMLVQYLVNLTMLQHFFGVPHVEDAYWTLTIELIFYVLIYVLLRLRLLRHIEHIGLWLVLVLAAWQQIPQVRLAYLSAARLLPLMDFFPLFLAGIVFYKIRSERVTAYRYALIAICFAAQMANCGGRLYYISYQQYLVALVLYFLCFLLFVHGRLRFIVGRPTVWLGLISYALYLIHHEISEALLLPMLHNRLHLPIFVCYGIALAVVVALAAFITFYIEVPGRKRFRDVARRLLGLSK